MSRTMNDPIPSLERDERLAQALLDLQRAPPDQQPRVLDAACKQHPDLAEELRQLVAVGQIVSDLAQSSAANDPAVTLIHNKAPTQAPAALLPRRFGAYDLQEELGRGGMGVVYKAWDQALKRPVALKMILRGRQASSADLARFRVEAQAAAGLEHPNIVPVYQVGEHDGQAYFSMKYVEGRPLSTLIAEGPLPPRTSAQLMTAVARAVQHAHEKGVLHRDLKPANKIGRA